MNSIQFVKINPSRFDVMTEGIGYIGFVKKTRGWVFWVYEPTDTVIDLLSDESDQISAKLKQLNENSNKG